MYRVNIFLRIILFFLALIALLVANNLVVLWVLLVILTFINYRKSKILLLIDFILIILLAISSRIIDLLIVYRIVYIVDMVLTFIYFLSEDDKVLFKYRKSNVIKKEDFYEKIFNDVYEENENKVKEKYREIDFDDRIDYYLDRKYLKSKIRYGTFSKEEKVSYEWNKVDSMILILSIITFILLIIYR